jgi:HEAT repeat protein
LLRILPLLGDPVVLDWARRNLTHPHRGELAAEVVLAHPPAAVQELLPTLLAAASSDVRLSALSILLARESGEAMRPEALGWAGMALRDGDPRVRAVAAGFLTRSSDERVLNRLMVLALQDHVLVRQALVAGLSERRSRGLVVAPTTAVAALLHVDSGLRRLGLDLLLTESGEAAMRSLLGSLVGLPAPLRARVLAAFRGGDDRLDALLGRLLASGEPAVAGGALLAAAERPTLAVAELTAGLPPSLRDAALAVPGRHRRSSDAIRELLTQPGRRWGALDVIVRAEDRESLPDTARLLRAGAPAERLTVVRAIAALPDPRTEPVLHHILAHDDDLLVRVAAARALRSLSASPETRRRTAEVASHLKPQVIPDAPLDRWLLALRAQGGVGVLWAEGPLKVRIGAGLVPVAPPEGPAPSAAQAADLLLAPRQRRELALNRPQWTWHSVPGGGTYAVHVLPTSEGPLLTIAPQPILAPALGETAPAARDGLARGGVGWVLLSGFHRLNLGRVLGEMVEFLVEERRQVVATLGVAIAAVPGHGLLLPCRLEEGETGRAIRLAVSRGAHAVALDAALDESAAVALGEAVQAGVLVLLTVGAGSAAEGLLEVLDQAGPARSELRDLLAAVPGWICDCQGDCGPDRPPFGLAAATEAVWQAVRAEDREALAAVLAPSAGAWVIPPQARDRRPQPEAA